ncbi:MAG TPA: universal stress protein, partial [Gemmatimonadaceae bacterium]
MQLNRVLVGIDFSAPSLAAARWVAEHFAPRAELVLIHVIPEPRTPPYLARVRRAAHPDTATAERTTALLGGLMALASSLGGPRATADV